MPDRSQEPQIHVIATQHLDVAYLWPRHPDGEELMRRCFERAIEMIEAQPEGRFVFSRSTPWSFHILEQKHPGLFARIERYVDQGRIELCGGQWVEPDNLLPDGETLVRESLYGQGYLEQRFGQRASVAWNPDVFAHGDTLPQILAGSGLSGYYFHRCLPLDEDGRERTQFVWEGLDGTRVLVFAGRWRGKPDGEALRACLSEAEREPESVLFHVSGANSDRRVTMETSWLAAFDEARRETGATGARWSTASDVLAELARREERLPVVRGELGFQFSGTYTSEGRIKRRLRGAEALLADAEKASACAALLGHAYPSAALGDAWRDLCVNAFHDIACGTCYQHVHEEALELFAQIERQGARIRRDATRFLAAHVDTQPSGGREHGPALLVFNTLSWARRAPVVVQPSEGDVDLSGREVLGRDGEAMPTQTVTLENGSTGVAFVPSQPVAPLSYAKYALREAPPWQPQAPVAPFTLESKTLAAQLDPATGELCRLYDREHGVELLRAGGRGNRLVFYEDRSEMANYEPWLIGYTGRVLDAGQATSVRQVESGPVRSAVRVVRRVTLDPGLPPTEIVQDVVLYADLPYLVFQTRGNWQATRVMLKAEFDLAPACTRIVCDMPYGVAERAPHGGVGAYRVGQGSGAEDGLAVGTKMDEPDRPMGKWLDYGDGKVGVAFLNNGKYGYEAASHQVRLSLMRAPVHRDGVTVGLGPFAFSYALMPHSGDWRDARLPQWGYGFNHDLLPLVADEHPGRALEGKPAYEVSAPGVLITAIKRAEAGTGTVLRLYESLGRRTEVRLHSLAPILAAASCDLLETPLDDGGACRRVSEHEIDLAFRPFEIKTVLLRHGGPAR